MSKGLEALEELQSEWEFDNNLPKCFVDTRVSIIEKELKALEIIKKRRVDMNLLIYSRSYKAYIKYVKTYYAYTKIKIMIRLTQEEYDLLKEN